MQGARMNSSDLNRLIRATEAFVNPFDYKHTVAQYIRLDFSAENDLVTAYSIDGYCMAVEHCKCWDIYDDFTAYIKPPLSIPERETVSIFANSRENKLIITGDGYEYQLEQPKHPLTKNFFHEDLIPEKKKIVFRIAFDADKLAKALDAARISAEERYNPPVILEFYGAEEAAILRTNSDDLKLIMPIKLNPEDINS